jgi:hypothetical protein
VPRNFRREGDEPTQRIYFADGVDWVELRRHLTMGDSTRIENATIKVRAKSNASIKKGKTAPSDVFEVAYTPGDSGVAKIFAGLAAWGGPGFCVDDHEPGVPEDPTHEHRPIPLSLDQLLLMDDEHGKQLVRMVGEMYPEADEDSPNMLTAGGQPN